jgi:hypothetical protein
MKNNKKVADQLLAVTGRIIGVGQDLHAVTSSMLDAADNAEPILAWASWTGELTSDILGAVDGLLCAVHDLSGSNRKETRSHG